MPTFRHNHLPHRFLNRIIKQVKVGYNNLPIIRVNPRSREFITHPPGRRRRRRAAAGRSRPPAGRYQMNAKPHGLNLNLNSARAARAPAGSGGGGGDHSRPAARTQSGWLGAWTPGQPLSLSWSGKRANAIINLRKLEGCLSHRHEQACLRELTNADSELNALTVAESPLAPQATCPSHSLCTSWNAENLQILSAENLQILSVPTSTETVTRTGSLRCQWRLSHGQSV